MLRSQRLAVVLALEERRENAALEKMNAARATWEGEQQRLDELRRYQQDYQIRMRAQQQGTIAVARLQGWQAFITQLDQLLVGQQARVNQARERFDGTREQWQLAWERRRGMEKYIATCRRQEQSQQDLNEQKQLDEAAGRQFSRRR